MVNSIDLLSKFFYTNSERKIFTESSGEFIRGSKGFDRGLAAGEAIRCDTLITKLN